MASLYPVTNGVDPLLGFSSGDAAAWSEMSAPPVSSLSTSDSFGGLPSNFTPQSSGTGLFGGMSGMDKIGLGIDGLKTLAGLWSAWQSMKMAKKEFKFNKNMWNVNLGNQVKAYNNSLEDKISTRYQLEGLSPEQASSYLSTHSLNKKGT